MDLLRLKKDLIRDEGLKLKPYLCPAGKLTIGIGRNIEDNGITEEEALHLLENDITLSIGELEEKLPFFANLDPVRQETLVNMAFNLGITRLMGFQGMIAALGSGDFDLAAQEMLDSKWARQVGKRAQRLAAGMKEGGQ